MTTYQCGDWLVSALSVDIRETEVEENIVCDELI